MDEAGQFFESVTATFGQALEKNALINRYYEIGGYCICMQFAGNALIPFLTPAFEHLRTGDQKSPHLTIKLWDSASTNTPMLASPFSKEAFAHQGKIRQYNTDRMYTLFQPGEDTLNMLNLSENTAFFWRRDTLNIPYYTVGAPLRSILHWWMNNNDRQLLHAAAVGTKDGAALIVGKGGSGKSTTALSCLRSDLLYAGDDYTLLSIKPSPYIYSLFNSAKLDVGHTKRFPHLMPFIHNSQLSEEDKDLVLLYAHLPEKMISGIPIKVILLPQVTGKRDTTFSKASPTAALTALAPSTLFQLTRNRTESFTRIAALVKQIPAYILHCGTDIQQIPDVISTVLTNR